MTEFRGQNTFVTDLSAAFCVERRRREDYTSFLTVGDFVHQLAILPDSDNLACRSLFINRQLADIDGGQVGHSHAGVFSTGVAGAGALLVHSLVKAFLIEFQTIFMENFFRQFPRETKGIVKAEGNFAVERRLAGSLNLFDFGTEKFHTLIEGSSETVFFEADNLLDVISLVDEFFKVLSTAVDFHSSIDCTFEELVFDAEHAAMTDSTAQDAAQHIAAAFVGGQNAVHNHDGHGAVQEVRFKVGLLFLYNGSKSLQTTARIDVLMGQVLVGTIFLLVVLREHEVPDFEVSIAVTANCTVRRAAAAFFAQVDVDFGVRTAGARADFPEVIFHLDDMVLREARLGFPDFDGFIIIRINRNPEFVLRQFDDFRQEFPCPGNSFALEVIAKGEVAQHFKERLMAGGAADIFDIAGTHAALAGGHPGAGRLHLAREKGLQRRHAGTNQEKRRVILRNQGKAGQAQMAFFLGKKLQISLTQFIATHVLQTNLPPY